MLLNNKFLFVICLTALLAVWSVAPAAAQSKVGFVNTQRLLEETIVGRSAQDDLAKLGKEKDRQISVSAQRINDLKKELTANPGAALQRKLDALYAAHEELVKKSNEEIHLEEARLIQFILRHADKSLRKIAQEQGFSLVLTDPNIVGYIDASADITDLIIQEMNRD